MFTVFDRVNFYLQVQPLIVLFCEKLIAAKRNLENPMMRLDPDMLPTRSIRKQIDLLNQAARLLDDSAAIAQTVQLLCLKMLESPSQMPPQIAEMQKRLDSVRVTMSAAAKIGIKNQQGRRASHASKRNALNHRRRLFQQLAEQIFRDKGKLSNRAVARRIRNELSASEWDTEKYGPFPEKSEAIRKHIQKKV